LKFQRISLEFAMALKTWLPPEKKIPSNTYLGHASPDPIYTAVGAALSRWEHLESGLTRLFQLLCETPSLAACRAYGTIESCFLKSQMLRSAAEVFFDMRQPFDEEHSKAIKELFAAYEKAQELRNNVAHGMVVGYLTGKNRTGYFLCPQSGATKKITRRNKPYLEKIAYFYDATEVNKCAERFTALLDETMRLIQSINKKYAVLTPLQFHQ
jgi:hypothetical protein